MQRKMITLIAVLLLVAGGLSAMVPPHPKARITRQIELKETARTKGVDPATGKIAIPNNILVLRVQFSDLSFVSAPVYPDYLAHDEAYFERWMVHLKDFFNDASHFQYNLNWQLYPQVISLPRPLSYYGGDSSEYYDASLEQIVEDIVLLKDAEIDFSLYGGIIIFHAGAGQETDIGLESNNFSGMRPDTIWSTIITRKDLQRYYDPENDEYMGYPTNDGILLRNIVVVPEHTFHDYFPLEGQTNFQYYLFSIYGVLAHQYARMIGLPSLFDTVSSNGRSQGIGNFGLMGTGMWNAEGYVPAQLSAWSRMYLGWDIPITISSDATELSVDHFLNHASWAQRLYKIPISEKEYFLVENRQQNPDNSTDPHNWMPSFTFALLPEGEQEYYPAPDSLRPYFNFMTNRYGGCEWDFFLPGYGGPIPDGYASPQDGSGLLIWHIDENIIEANFDPLFDMNRINGDAYHKGVDLEEADGTQHLDTSTQDTYKWGSPFDSFRGDNNAYFGNQINNGLLSLPTAASYYGGVPLEIYNIGASDLNMTFSVRFNWKLETGYTGMNPIGAAGVSFGSDPQYIFYPMPSGAMYLWQNEQLVESYPAFGDSIHHTYVWDTDAIYVPMQASTIARLYRIREDDRQYIVNKPERIWASHPVARKLYVPESGEPGFTETLLILPLNSTTDQQSELVVWDVFADDIIHTETFDEPIASNLIFDPDGNAFGFTRNPSGSYRLFRFQYLRSESSKENNPELSWHIIDFPADSTIVSISMARILPGSSNNNLIVQTPYSIYVYGDGYVLADGFPYVSDFVSSSPLTISDVDGNSLPDIIVGGENSFVVVDYSGAKMSTFIQELGNHDETGISSGVMAVDIDNDGKVEYLGNFSRNRLMIWEDNYKQKRGYPVSFVARSRTLPFIHKASDQKFYAWSATDDGMIFRTLLPDNFNSNMQDSWCTEYANYLRNAYYYPTGAQNQYQTTKTFVDGEVYLFPNPLKSYFDQKITLNLMTSIDTVVKIAIFDISGKLIHEQKSFAKSYLRNRDAIDIPVKKMTSGVYIAVLSAGGETKRLKFALEK